MWTRFMDMYSGGSSKEQWECIYIEAPEAEARVIFYNRFGHNADCVTCTCCGSDYFVSEDEDLASLTAYDRNCAWSKDGGYVERPRYDDRPVTPIKSYLKRDDVLLIKAKQIKKSERRGEVPEQGFVWV